MLWKSKCHDSNHNSHISSKINTSYKLLFHFLEVQFNVILSPIHTSSSDCLTKTLRAFVFHPKAPNFLAQLNITYFNTLIFGEKLPVT